MEQKKYVDIERCKEKYVQTFVKGENIVIEEKIDGSNASIRYDEKTNTLVAFSRRKQLNEENTLNGFYDYVQRLPVDEFKKIIGTRYIIFGEWLGATHAVKYAKNLMQKFYMFDVYDTETEQYCPFAKAVDMYLSLAAYIPSFVPIIYVGEFVSFDHILSYVGKSWIGGSPCGEGIVIKRQDYLDSKSSRIPSYVKIVAEEFSEVHKSKKQILDPEKIAEREKEESLVAEVVTERRIGKILDGLIEDSIIPADWDEHNMKDISKTLPKTVFEDCRKEEPETVNVCENFGKICAKLTMGYVRKLLNER